MSDDKLIKSEIETKDYSALIASLITLVLFHVYLITIYRINKQT
jgi:hypothetical protein